MKVKALIATCALLCMPGSAFADEAWVSMGRMKPDGRGAFFVLDLTSIKKETSSAEVHTSVVDMLAPAQGTLIVLTQRVDCAAKTLTALSAKATRPDGSVNELSPTQPTAKKDLGPAEQAAITLVCAPTPKAPEGTATFPSLSAVRSAIRAEPAKY